MKDAAGLDVTVHDSKTLETINVLVDLFFRKKSGIDKLLPSQADAHPDCPMLQVCAAFMCFFSFSLQSIQGHFPTYLSRIENSEKNDRENLHFEALKLLQIVNLDAALQVYMQIVKKYPADKLGVLMVETCGFLSGNNIDKLFPIYERLYPCYHEDPDFLAMFSFLLVHLGQLVTAREHIMEALRLSPHNAWVQHVYAHTIDEYSPAIEDDIKILETFAVDWSKQNRFFEGHNWMHLCALYFKRDEIDFDAILAIYNKHIWGEAKSFSFEQNNAFWVLWQAHLHGYADAIPFELKADLAVHAEPFMYDYLTPYLTVSAILSVALFDLSKARTAASAFAKHAATLTVSKQSEAWYGVAVPVLQGCLQYLEEDYCTAETTLAPAVAKIRAMGHSDEQTSVFLSTFKRAKACCKKYNLNRNTVHEEYLSRVSGRC